MNTSKEKAYTEALTLACKTMGWKEAAKLPEIKSLEKAWLDDMDKQLEEPARPWKGCGFGGTIYASVWG